MSRHFPPRMWSPRARLPMSLGLHRQLVCVGLVSPCSLLDTLPSTEQDLLGTKSVLPLYLTSCSDFPTHFRKKFLTSPKALISKLLPVTTPLSPVSYSHNDEGTIILPSFRKALSPAKDHQGMHVLPPFNTLTLVTSILLFVWLCSCP